MKECAFCRTTGKMSAEHIPAQWTRELLPGKKNSFYVRPNSNRNERFQTDTIDWKAKVVCENCNTTWMSDIEGVHGKPVLTPFIIGNIGIPITPGTARSIALYAFKTAVVTNHADRKLQPFFSDDVRHNFRSKHLLPNNFDVWVCGIKHHRSDVHVQTVYYSGQISPANYWKMFVLTCAIGNFVMQAVAVNQSGRLKFVPNAGYENIGISMRRPIPSGYVWPGRKLLDGADGFKGFANRWENVLHGNIV